MATKKQAPKSNHMMPEMAKQMGTGSKMPMGKGMQPKEMSPKGMAMKSKKGKY